MLSSVLGPAVMPQVTFPGSQQGLTSIALISDSGSNQRFSFALTTLPTASTVVAAHMSSLFTLNKEKQKLFLAVPVVGVICSVAVVALCPFHCGCQVIFFFFL